MHIIAKNPAFPAPHNLKHHSHGNPIFLFVCRNRPALQANLFDLGKLLSPDVERSLHSVHRQLRHIISVNPDKGAAPHHFPELIHCFL